MNDIAKFPIILFSNYRTGSTPLMVHLAEKYRIKQFMEPSGRYLHDYKQQIFVDYFRSGKTDFVVKFMPDHIPHLPEIYEQLLYGQGYKIFLNRKDRIAQIASYYVAYIRNKWHLRHSEEEPEDYTIDIDYDTLRYAAGKIIRNDKEMDEYRAMMLERDIPIDEEISYEQLGYIDNSAYTVDKDPENMSVIRHAIVELLG